MQRLFGGKKMTQDWLKIIVPVVLSGILIAVSNLYDDVDELEKSVLHRDVLEHRMNTIECDVADNTARVRELKENK